MGRIDAHDLVKLLRLAGLGIVAAGAAVMLWNIRSGGPHVLGVNEAAFVALGLGWALLIVAILMRSRYLRRKRSGE